jgi:multicomponent Na+:H+ antiporter subunit C
MTPGLIYALVGIVLFVLAAGGVILLTHPVRRILAFNLMGSGVFLVLVGLAQRDGQADPVPQALVLTGIVVSSAPDLGRPRLRTRTREGERAGDPGSYGPERPGPGVGG